MSLARWLRTQPLKSQISLKNRRVVLSATHVHSGLATHVFGRARVPIPSRRVRGFSVPSFTTPVLSRAVTNGATSLGNGCWIWGAIGLDRANTTILVQVVGLLRLDFAARHRRRDYFRALAFVRVVSRFVRPDIVDRVVTLTVSDCRSAARFGVLSDPASVWSLCPFLTDVADNYVARIETVWPEAHGRIDRTIGKHGAVFTRGRQVPRWIFRHLLVIDKLSAYRLVALDAVRFVRPFLRHMVVVRVVIIPVLNCPPYAGFSVYVEPGTVLLLGPLGTVVSRDGITCLVVAWRIVNLGIPVHDGSTDPCGCKTEECNTDAREASSRMRGVDRHLSTKFDNITASY